jgi:hypothetical protein
VAAGSTDDACPSHRTLILWEVQDESFCVAASTLSIHIHFHDKLSVVSDFAGIVSLLFCRPRLNSSDLEIHHPLGGTEY